MRNSSTLGKLWIKFNSDRSLIFRYLTVELLYLLVIRTLKKKKEKKKKKQSYMHKLREVSLTNNLIKKKA